MSERITVRPARQSDHDVIKRICLETAYEGKSAAPYLTIPELPALVWALPYISLPTGFGFVMVEQGVPADTCTCTASATSIAGDSGTSSAGTSHSHARCTCERVVGYVVGTSDTSAYEVAAEEHWWPVIRAAYLSSDDLIETTTTATVREEEQDGLTSLDRHYLSLIRTGTHAPSDVLAFSGATIHIDILPEYQGKGWGRRLMQLAITQLERRGARALWVGSNGEEGRRFYRKVGFRPIRDKFFGLRFDEFKSGSGYALPIMQLA